MGFDSGFADERAGTRLIEGPLDDGIDCREGFKVNARFPGKTGESGKGQDEMGTQENHQDDLTLDVGKRLAKKWAFFWRKKEGYAEVMKPPASPQVGHRVPGSPWNVTGIGDILG